VSLVTTVPLSGKRSTGSVALIDLDDLGKVWGTSWHLSDTGYAVNRNAGKTTRMHRVIAGTPRHLVTDHINHDTLDNRRANLRSCTVRDNARNFGYKPKGYSYNKDSNNWHVQVYKVIRAIFDTEAEAKDFAEKCYAGTIPPIPSRWRGNRYTHCVQGHEYVVTGSYRPRGATLLPRCKVCCDTNNRNYKEMRRNNEKGTN